MERTLESLGWDEFFAAQVTAADDPGLFHARVVAEHRGAYRIVGAGAREEMWAAVTGRVRRSAGATGLPAVGDWVAARMVPEEGRAAIQHVLPRRSAFTRKAAGQDAAQVVAANVDVVLVVTSLNSDFNPRRLERYLTLAWNSGAAPVVVLNKADLCADVDAMRAAAERIAIGLPVHAVSARAGSGLDALRAYLGTGRTIVLLGSSGVGKSTLVNVLGGRDVQAVGETLDDDRGVHTTTARQMLFLPDGGMLIDTPGIREVGLVGDEEGLERAFADVRAVMATCRFTDCRHETDPDCAVTAALASGVLPSERWESYRKLQRELVFQATREDPQLARSARAHAKQAQRELRAPDKPRRR